jgi:hypothetical protein
VGVGSSSSRVTAVALLVTLAFGFSTASAETPRERKLAAKVESLNDQRVEWKRRAQVAERRVSEVEADNARLRAGLPDAILAVPVSEFWRLVFAPARQAWRCDSLYTETGYWSLEFTSSC